MEYIRDFDWYLLRCHIPEVERTIILRFTSGIRDEFQEEHISQRVHTLQQAYHLAQNIESYRYSLLIGYESNHRSYPLPKPTATQPTQQPIKSYPKKPATPSKVEQILPTISKVRCAPCQDFGQEVIQCPNNNPSQGETREKCGKIEEVIYEPPTECIYVEEEEESDKEIESLSEISLSSTESSVESLSEISLSSTESSVESLSETSLSFNEPTEESNHTDDTIVSCDSTQHLSPEILCEDSSLRAIALVNQSFNEISVELEDCVNDLSRDTLIRIEPKLILHPQPCVIFGIESKSLFIAEEHLTSFQSIGFQDPF